MGFLQELAKYNGGITMSIPRKLVPMLNEAFEKYGRVPHIEEYSRTISGVHYDDVYVRITPIEEHVLNLELARWNFVKKYVPTRCIQEGVVIWLFTNGPETIRIQANNFEDAVVWAMEERDRRHEC